MAGSKNTLRVKARDMAEETTIKALDAPKNFLPARLRTWLRFARQKPLGATGVGILLIATIVGIIGPAMTPHDPLKANAFAILLPPDNTYWFGTDVMGRDILTRCVLGARVSLYVGILSMAAAATLGSIIGVTSGFFGGKYDIIIQRFVDALSAFPSLLLAIALMAAFGQSLNNIILALAIIFTPRFTRVVRAVTLSLKEVPYIEAARTIGASNIRIMALHVFPNTFASVMVVSTASVGTMIIIEASLSFLGVGTPSHIISWGAMLSGDTQAYFSGAPWIGIFPGMALTIVVFGINVFGDALRDILDPKLRGR